MANKDKHLPTQGDSSQQQFICAPEENIRLLAPAGCGKTLCLLLRCKHLGEAKRQRFLIISFTRAAQQELQSRINEDYQFARLRDSVDVTTLNSWGYRRIKSAAAYPQLLTKKDQFFFAVKNTLQPVWAKHDAVRKAIEAKPNQIPRKILEAIDQLKSLGFDHMRDTTEKAFLSKVKYLREEGLNLKLEELVNNLVKIGILEPVDTRSGEHIVGGDRKLYSAFYQFWVEASRHLVETSVFTLEDQKYFAYLDERQKLEEGRFLSGIAKYDHVFVDEFQDINPLDLALIKAITERSRATLHVIGDDDQAIFEWRGATPEFILNPDKYFGVPFTTYKLERNYRSPRNIVEFSQNLIRHNTKRVAKDVRPELTHDAEIRVEEVAGLAEGMDLVVSEVDRSIKDGAGPSSIAILGRKRSQIIPYQVYFASKDIPFCAAEDLQIFMSEAFDRLIELIDIKTRSQQRQRKGQIIDDIMKLCNLAKKFPLSKADHEVLRRHLNINDFTSMDQGLDVLADCKAKIKGVADGKVAKDMANAIRSFASAKSVTDALDALSDGFIGLQLDMGKAEDDIFFVDPPFEHLAEYALRYGDDYNTFLDDIERAKNVLVHVPPFEVDGDRDGEDLWKRPIHLMTALRAKGKEFNSVVILDANADTWPMKKNAKTPSGIEAERRVFYVAFTRAKERVTMIVSKHLGGKPAAVSPFISELGLPS